MPPRYLLDTNIASYIIKGNSPRVRAHLLKIPIADVAISTVTEAELRFGVSRRPDRIKLRTVVEEFLLRVDILPWESEAAQRYAEVRASLEREGAPMGNLDMMIASHALAADRVLVSSDRAFRRVRGLRIEDWTKV